MQGLENLQLSFETYFAHRHFPSVPKTLYDPLEEFLANGGKRIRPVMCLLGNELFGNVHPDAYHISAAIELFHNFTLVHDDIMDKAPLRRGKPTVHQVHGEPTALLGGDVMLVAAYEYINRIDAAYLKKVLSLFNRTAREVCEGQQLDMDFESLSNVTLSDYLTMITLKTSVLLAASLQMGAIVGGASEGNQQLIYSFGKNLGIAFQIQDDYLDAFGDPLSFGKQVGGDIRSNKKTFLLIHALEAATGSDREQLHAALLENTEDKVERVLGIYKRCGVDMWAEKLKQDYLNRALHSLEEIAVSASRKQSLVALSHYLIKREK